MVQAGAAVASRRAGREGSCADLAFAGAISITATDRPDEIAEQAILHPPASAHIIGMNLRPRQIKARQPAVLGAGIVGLLYKALL